jgi:ubiquinol-cytochrome c reductase iron-sulfur subunit
VTRLKDWLLAALVLALGRGESKPPEPERPRIVPKGAQDRRAEDLVLTLFALALVAAAAFIAVYALDRLGHQTQFLGLSLGLSFLLLALACVVISRRLVVTEELMHEYPTPSSEEQDAVTQIIEESGSRFTRKRLVVLAGSGAVGTLGLAALTPALSLGPVFDQSSFLDTPWQRGRRLVDEGGKPLAAAAIEHGSFYTAYPEGADRELMGSPLVVVRIAEGVVAYSKICTHAGCAITLYRKPTFAPTEPRPALVCPCHYSTFDPAQNGKVLFGPAGRPLPRLPLETDGEGNLRAAGTFSGPVGPSWSGVRYRRPS